uniref:Synapse associated protein 1 n=1 Tax=Eptatretus burgeri TaxID=7764 RepID=A0A8C4QGC3_EPTBU
MFQAVSDWFGSVSRDEAHETDEFPCGGDVEGNVKGNVDTRGDEVAAFGTIMSTASSFTKRVSESMLESAQSLRKSVQEGKLDHFLDKTIIGEFQKEQDKFTKEKQKNKGEEAVLPWVGYTDEDSIRQQILALSADRRNFLRDPPAGVLCPYDRESAAALGQLLLQEDHVLCEMRFKLVPRLIKEEVFWRNYLYRVSLVKQSADLTSLGQSSLGGWAGPQHSHLDGSRPKTPPKAVTQPSQAVADRATGEENQISMSPSGIEFASDAFPEPSVSQEDLLRGMEQLGMDKTSENEVLPEWERELARELSEFEVVEEGEKGSEAWEQEIEQILQEDS